MGTQAPTLSVEYKVDFNNSDGKRKARKQTASPKATSPKIPRVTKLLALAHHLQDLLDQGIVKDYADIARLSGLSRARVTQVMNLTLLAPEIQEKILKFTDTSPVRLKEPLVRRTIQFPLWTDQVRLWKNFKPVSSH